MSDTSPPDPFYDATAEWWPRPPNKNDPVLHILRRIEHNQGATMAAIDDLNTAVTALQAEQAAVDTTVTDLVAEVAALNAAIAANDPAAIEAAATSISAVVSALTTDAASDPGPQA